MRPILKGSDPAPKESPMAFKDKFAKLKDRFPSKSEELGDEGADPFAADAPDAGEGEAPEAESDPFAEGAEGEGNPALMDATDEDLQAELEKRGFKVEAPAGEAAEGEGEASSES